MERELMNPSPAVLATPEEFQDTLKEFRREVWLFFEGLAQKYSPNGLSDFGGAVKEFDERLFYMAFGLKDNVDPETLAHLVNEVNLRKDVILHHFDNPDVIKGPDSFRAKIPQATNFIRAAMIGNQALSDEAKNELKGLDDIHKE